MRATVISQVPPPVHGSTVMTARLIASLKGAGISVHLVDRRFSRTVNDVGRMSVRKLASAVGLWWRVWRSGRRHRSDVAILFGTNRLGSFVIDSVSLTLLHWSKVPIVNYVHTVGFEAIRGRGRLFAWLVDRMMNIPAATVVLGPTLALDVAGARKLVVIPNAAEDEGAVAPRAGRNVVLFLSNFLPEKGAGDFLSMAETLSDDFPSVEFVAAGADVAGEVSRLSGRYAGSANLRVVGPIDAAERQALFERALVLVFPSVYPYEAQPLTIIEAASAAVPTVAYATGGIVDLVVDDENGLLVAPANVEELTAAVRRILRQPRLQQRLSEASRSSFEERHSIAAYKNNWQTLLSGFENDA